MESRPPPQSHGANPVHVCVRPAAAYAMAIDWATDLSAMAVEESNPTLKDAMRGVANATAKAESVRKYLLVSAGDWSA